MITRKRLALLVISLCIVLIPTVIVIGFDNSIPSCMNDIGQRYTPTTGFGCTPPELLIQNQILDGNGTFLFTIFNPAPTTISISAVTITNYAYPVSTLITNYPEMTGTVNGSLTTNPAYSMSSRSFTNTNVSLSCTGAFVPIASNSLQSESCNFFSQSIASGDEYSYSITFSAGLPILGSLIVQ